MITTDQAIRLVLDGSSSSNTMIKDSGMYKVVRSESPYCIYKAFKRVPEGCTLYVTVKDTGFGWSKKYELKGQFHQDSRYKDLETIYRHFSVILKAAKIRAVLDNVKNRKNDIVRSQNFEEAAKLRDKEKLLWEKLEEVNGEMLKIYAEHFPEESALLDSEFDI